MAAAAHAYSLIMGNAILPAQLDLILTSIEPTDGVYYPGICSTDFIRGGLIRRYGAPPPIGVIIVDTGGRIATHGVDRAAMRNNCSAFRAQFQEALSALNDGFLTQDPRLIGRAATLSAEINQHVYAKPFFSKLTRLIGTDGIVGINCAHSGTLLGVMFDESTACPDYIEAKVIDIVGSRHIFGIHRMIGGGVRYELSAANDVTGRTHPRQRVCYA